IFSKTFSSSQFLLENLILLGLTIPYSFRLAQLVKQIIINIKIMFLKKFKFMSFWVLLPTVSCMKSAGLCQRIFGTKIGRKQTRTFLWVKHQNKHFLYTVLQAVLFLCNGF